MLCTIDWNLLNFSEWNAYFKEIPYSTVLQSYEYALSMAPIYGQKPRWGLISIDGQKAGLCQIMEAGVLKNTLHAVILDRGPLWFEGFGTFEHFKAFAHEFDRQFPKRLLRKRRFIPEIQNSTAVTQHLQALGFQKASQTYQTYWLDLDHDLQTLEKNLKKKWRYSLNKARETDLEIIWEEQGKGFQSFLVKYEADKDAKSYDGPSAKLLSALAENFAPSKNLLIGYAYLESKACAAILILCHGQSATYQVGWTTDEGRNANAHHYILWEALETLKSRGIRQFDLGGIHDQAKGIKTFKQGMGGKHSELAGLFT